MRRIVGRKGRTFIEEGKFYNCRANDKGLIMEPLPIDEGTNEGSNLQLL